MSGIPVFSAGTSLQSSGVSVSAQIPADSAGMLPLFVRVTATAAGYFRLSQDGASAAIGDLLIQPSDGLILKTCGLSQFSFVSQSGASTVTVTPIDVGGIKYPTNIFTPGWLFTTGVNGAWYDPSDFSTMFQDAAGTVPVTAVGQPVGLILDKSGRGNHAYNPSGNSANFPVLSASYNLLTKTEDFSDAVWVTNAVSVSPNTAADPFGMVTADKLIESSANAAHYLSTQAQSVTVGVTYTISIYAKAAERSVIQIVPSGTTFGTSFANFDLSNGTLGSSNGVTTKKIVSVGNGWYFCSISVTATATVSTGPANFALQNSPSAARVAAYQGDGTSGVYIWGADLRVANDALNQPAYQRVNTATDYDTVGFKPYLAFNGVNQSLRSINSIDFTYGDKMFVSAGVRKLSDVATGMLAELSADLGNNTGAFGVVAPSAAGANSYRFSSKGSSGSGDAGTGVFAAAPTTNIISGIGNISAPSAILRVNGSQNAQSTATQGAGNYGNYPIYIGARAGSSLWFNGRLYGLIVAGKAASASEIVSTEAWLNQKTGAY